MYNLVGFVASDFVGFDTLVGFCVSLFPSSDGLASLGVFDRDLSMLPRCILRPALPTPMDVSISSCTSNSSLLTDTCQSMHSRH